MTISLFDPSPDLSDSCLHLLVGYEDGRVAHFRFTGSRDAATSEPTKPIEEGQNWELLWDEKGHREAGASHLIKDNLARAGARAGR